MRKAIWNPIRKKQKQMKNWKKKKIEKKIGKKNWKKRKNGYIKKGLTFALDIYKTLERV